MNEIEIEYAILELDLMFIIFPPLYFLVTKKETRLVKARPKSTMKFVIYSLISSFFVIALDIYFTLSFSPSGKPPIPPLYVFSIFILFAFVFALIQLVLVKSPNYFC